MIKRLIITILRRLHPYPAPESVIRQEARQEIGHAGDGEVADALAFLRQKGYICDDFDDLTGDRRWKLTEKGMEDPSQTQKAGWRKPAFPAKDHA